MLEGYGLEIDSAESAEQALEYLKENKPDVIFMDHLMPGMDGFQAIQAIKSNPQTAMIPVMMYTSQEGDLYLSQARALGAVGVLPKTVKQTELSRILYQLRLLPERRDPRLVVATEGTERDDVIADETPTVQIDGPTKLSVGEIETAIRNAIGPALAEQNAEIRRFVASSLDAFARRIHTEAKPAASSPSDATVVIEEAPPPPPAPTGIRWPVAAALAALALLPSIALAVLYTRTMNLTAEATQANARLAAVVQEQQTQLATLQASLRAPAAGSLSEGESTNENAMFVESEPVPYGEAPLAGRRLDRFRDIVNRLRDQGFHGTMRISMYVGEFCLTGNGIEGYSIAAEDLPVKRCDLVGNPFDDSLTSAQRQSVGFANLLSTIKQQTGDALAIEMSYIGRKPAVPYPDGEHLNRSTAGEWNRIAAQNNRVEFQAIPAS
jgi:CheY-like chemotaxis protein